MKIRFYTLLYIDSAEKRKLSGRVYDSNERIDLFVKNACVLDKTLRLCCSVQGIDGCTILTNDVQATERSLERVNKCKLGGVKSIAFTTKVPKGISFYSAHFKIDVMRWFASRPKEEYSVLLDNDVVCVAPLPPGFIDMAEADKPLNYTLRGYLDNERRRQMRDICNDVNSNTVTWSGGELIGGTALFYKRLVEKIDRVLPHYFDMIAKEKLFHTGDEMPVSIAWHLLRQEGIIPTDAFDIGLLYRYWGNLETKPPLYYGTSLLHIPYDKVFLAGISIDRLKSPDDIVRLYRYRRMRNTIVRYVKKLIRRK